MSGGSDAEAAPSVPGLDGLSLIGQGSFSVVYRALRDGQPVAVKLQRELHPSPEARRRVWQEAAALARLDHPGLCRVLSVGELDERIYIVMELVEGRSLAEHLARSPVSEAEARAVGAGIADALVEVHRLGLVHGDVKPRNILLDARGAPKLIDFGLVRWARSDEDLADSAFGTILYCAPEQFGLLKRPVDARSDLYALGIVLYELVAGEPPFQASDASELLRLHAAVVPKPLNERVPAVSEHFAGVLARLLAKDPDDRFQSARELAIALRREPTAEDAGAGPRGGVGPERTASGKPPEQAAGTDLRRGLLGEVPWVGGREPIERVVELWRQARRGSGRAALVVGESGSGKSRVLSELDRRLATEGAARVFIRCDRNDPLPLAFLRRAVDEMIRLLESGAARDSLAHERLLRAVGYGATFLQSLSPAFSRLFPRPARADASPATQFDAQGESHVVDAAVDVFKALALELDGLVLLIDDAQHLDGPSLRWLERIDRSRQAAPILVVLSVLSRQADGVRAEAEADRGSSTEAVERVAAHLTEGLGQDLRLTLSDFDVTSARRLVAGFLRSEAFDGELVDRLVARSGGNPLAILESMQALVDEGLLRFTWGRWVLLSAGLETLQLPKRLLDIIVERLKLLGAEGQRFLAVAAILGSRFDRELLRAVMAPHSVAFDEVLARAVAARVLEPVGGRTYAFLHERAREAVLETLTPAERSELHRRAFEELERARARDVAGAQDALVFSLAHHAFEGRSEATVTAAFRACSEAASLALSRFAHREANDWYGRARAVAELDPGCVPPARFFLEAGLAAEAVGAQESAEGLYRRAAATATAADRNVKGQAQIELGKLLTVKSEESAKSLREALSTLGERYPSSRLGSFLWTLGAWAWGFVWPARTVDDAQERERLRLVFAGFIQSAYTEFYNQRPLGMLQVPMLERGIVQRIGASDELALWTSGSSAIVAAVGLRGLSRRLGERGLALAEQLGNASVIGGALIHCAHGLELSGDPLGAERAFRRSLDGYRRWLGASERIGAAATLASNLHMRGYARQAMEVIEGLSKLDSERPVDAPTAAFAEIDTVDNVIVRVARLLLGLPVAPLSESVFDWRENRARGGPWMTAYTTGFLVLDCLCAGPPYERLDELLEGFLAQGSDLGTNHQLHQFTIAESWIRLELLERAVAELAPEEERRKRSRQLRAALARLRRGKHHPSVRAHWLAIEAKRLWAAGRVAASGRCAREAEETAQRFDNPWVLFELARLRATAYLDQGLPHAAQREARRALDLALQHGWSDRARRVTSEFRLTASASRSSLTQSSSGGSSTKSQSVAGADALHASRSLAALLQVSLASTTVLDPERQSRLVLDELVRVMGAERALLFLAPHQAPQADEGTAGAGETARTPRVTFYAGRDLEKRDVPEGAGYSLSVVNEVLRTRAPVVVGGAGAGELAPTESVLLHRLRSVMAVPLLIRDRILGVAYVDNRLARGIFTDADGAVFGAIAAHLAVAIETARSASLEAQVNAERARRQLSERFAFLTASLGASLELGEVLKAVLGHLTQLVPYRRAAVVLVEGDSASLAAQSGFDSEPVASRTVETPAGAAAWRQVLLSLSPGAAVFREPLPPPFEERRRLDSELLGVPLVVRGRSFGCMALEVPSSSTADDSRLQLIRAFAGHAAIAVENARLFEAVRAQAIHDALTGLFTRRQLFALLEHEASLALRRERGFAVLMLDVDHFKRVNDVHGHAVGDEVLVAVAGRLRQRARESDVIGRYGGEEFVVCLPDTNLAGARHAAEALRAVIGSTPIPTARGPLEVTASFGVAASDAVRGDVPGPGGAPEFVRRVLHEADQALYRAKAAGRNRVAVAGLGDGGDGSEAASRVGKAQADVGSRSES